MSLDASRTPPRPELPEHPAAHETRSRLEHARLTSLTQLHTLTHDSHPDEQLLPAHKTAIEQTLQEIDAAFARIEDGTYGTCQNCHTPVPEERLEILPYTRYCVSCRRHTTTT
ncbi:TraR/DksA family transcriptional regulator [Streptomyces sp. NPDC002795]|uniref:TraR/DksA family transcriptional regulator n=1 Tax=Streptomyces sp. NPDC002795 TaxID=3364665 RepID=UPI0036943283